MIANNHLKPYQTFSYIIIFEYYFISYFLLNIKIFYLFDHLSSKFLYYEVFDNYFLEIIYFIENI